MKCKKTEQYLIAKRFKGLDFKEQSSMEEHIKQCEYCQKLATEILEIKEVLTRKSNLEPPAYLRAKIMQGISKSGIKANNSWFPAWMPSLVSIGVILLFLLSTSLLNFKKDQMYREQIIKSYAEDIAFLSFYEDEDYVLSEAEEYTGFDILEVNL